MEININNKDNKITQNSNQAGEAEPISNHNILHFAKNMVTIAQKKTEEKNLIILGDKGAGKSTIFNNLIGISSQKESYSATSGINFNYIRQQLGQRKTIVNVYEIGGGPNNLELIKTIVNKNNFRNTFYVIVLDFSKPQGVLDSLKTFLFDLNNFIKELVSNDDIVEAIETKKNKFTDRNLNSDIKRLNFFPAEIIIVGNKYDFLEKRDIEQIKWTCKILRFFCHYYTLSLLYYKNSDQKLIKQLNNLIFNQAFASYSFDSQVNFTQKNEILPLYILYSKDSFEEIGDPRVLGSGKNSDLLTLWEDSYKTLYEKENDSNNPNNENEEKLIKEFKGRYSEPRIDEELSIFERKIESGNSFIINTAANNSKSTANRSSSKPRRKTPAN